jgi:hypothetical protein
MPFVITTQINVQRPEEWKKKIDAMVDKNVRDTLISHGLCNSKHVADVDVVTHYMSSPIREAYTPLLLESRCNEIKRLCLCHLLCLYDLTVLQKKRSSGKPHQALYTITVILSEQSNNYVAYSGMSCVPSQNRWLHPIIVID